MKILITEKWEYHEYVHWNIESLPDGWDEMDREDKAVWVADNGEYSHLESEPYSFIRVEDVEVQR